MIYMAVHFTVIIIIITHLYSPKGIVFDQLDPINTDIQYTLRLRHEVGEDNTWHTDETTPPVELPGPRVDDKYVCFPLRNVFNSYPDLHRVTDKYVCFPLPNVDYSYLDPVTGKYAFSLLYNVKL